MVDIALKLRVGFFWQQWWPQPAWLICVASNTELRLSAYAGGVDFFHMGHSRSICETFRLLDRPTLIPKPFTSAGRNWYQRS